MLSVTDSWVKWLWQHTAAWRIRFQAALESVPAPICQLKTGAWLSVTDDPRSATQGRRKAQSNTNKHEDQQMALCQSSFLLLTTPLSVLCLHLLPRFLILTIQYYVILILSLSPHLVSCLRVWHELSQVFFSSSPRSLDCCYYTQLSLFCSNYNRRRCEWKQCPWFHTWKMLIARDVLVKVRYKRVGVYGWVVWNLKNPEK